MTGYGDAGAALSENPLVDKVAFTGSTEVGRSILNAARGNLKKVSLELGGKSPNIICSDVYNMKEAIYGAASAIFFNQGQCCCAGSRLYVEENVYEEVLEGVIRKAEKIHLGNGMDPNTEMGPLVSKEQFDRVNGFMSAASDEGAQIATGGSKSFDKGYFFKPTVITNTRPDMKVVCEEIFGPVLTVTPFKNMEDLVNQANNTPYGLAAGIWTSDLKKAHQLSAQIKAGTTWINCYNIFDAALPFGGYKESGWGREMGKDAINLYTETKSVCLTL